MDRHEVQHVEAHGPDLRQARDAIVEGGALAGDRALRAREHLVPRGKPGRDAVHHHFQLLIVAHAGAAVGPTPRRAAHFVAQQQAGAAVVVVVLEQPQGLLEPRNVGALGARHGFLHKLLALDQFEADVLSGVQLLPHSVAPGGVQIRPRLDGVDVRGVFLENDAGDPPVRSRD